ncbi:MAG: methionine adenosyltransferase [Rikenellaceae bacterium]
MNYLFTSESVSAGHPDKVADQISDAILDAYLSQDPNAKVACECLCTTDMVVVAGEVKSSATVDVSALVRQTITAIGYTDSTTGFDATTCQIANLLHEQSSDIRQGVECAEQGAGDQGIMFGYATNETSQLIPATLYLSHVILQELDAIRREGKLMPYLRPDAKSQVTIEYNEFGKPLRIDTIVVSTQHDESVSAYDILSDVVAYLIPRVIERCPDLAELFQDDYRLLVNPTGRFVIGGPDGDTGLTGRKIIVDTYGGRAAHGGGAFSGKDSSKVDRSGAYMARYIAKNLVAAGVADECQVQIAYAIGVAEPVSVMVNTFDTNHTELTDSEIAHIVGELFDLRPASIVERFGLSKPIYSPTASYGHFGREPYIKDGNLHFGWERLDMVEELKQLLTINS